MCKSVQMFIDEWVSLLTDVLTAVPEAKGRLLLDLINEPDGYGFTWCALKSEACIPVQTAHRCCPLGGVPQEVQLRNRCADEQPPASSLTPDSRSSGSHSHARQRAD